MFNEKQLKKEINELKGKLDIYAGIEKENARINEINKDLVFKLSSANGKVREQTEADLLLQAERIKKEILTGKKKEEFADQTAYMNRLYGSLQQMPQGGWSSFNNYSLFNRWGW